VIDRDGVIRWSYVSPVAVNPGADGLLSALESLPPRQARASGGPADSDDTDFCALEGVVCAPTAEPLAAAVAAREGQPSCAQYGDWIASPEENAAIGLITG
jgi:hypothetical protein